MRYMLCYFNCNEYLVSDIWDVSLYNDQFREIKVDEYFLQTVPSEVFIPNVTFRERVPKGVGQKAERQSKDS